MKKWPLKLWWISNKTIMEVGNNAKAATFKSFLHLSYKNTQLLFLWTVLFNIFMRQTITNDLWGLHKNMNCVFPLKSRLLFNMLYCFYMFVNKHFTYLKCVYLKNWSVIMQIYCKIFILQDFQDFHFHIFINFHIFKKRSPKTKDALSSSISFVKCPFLKISFKKLFQCDRILSVCFGKT